MSAGAEGGAREPEALRSAVARARAPEPEHVEALTRRAAQLARVPPRERERPAFDAVLFTLAEERFALDARGVVEVAPLRTLTPLPSSVAPLFGLTHWRGEVLTVFDLRAALGVEPTGIADLSRLLVVEAEPHPFGCLVGSARELVRIERADVRPLARGDGGAGRLIAGVTSDGVWVLDPEKVKALAAPARREPRTANRRATDEVDGQ